MTNSPDQDPYQVLGVARDASNEIINLAYTLRIKTIEENSARESRVDLARKKLIAEEAFETLSDPAKRKNYDRANTATADSLRLKTQGESADKIHKEQQSEDPRKVATRRGWMAFAVSWVISSALLALFDYSSNSSSAIEAILTSVLMGVFVAAAFGMLAWWMTGFVLSKANEKSEIKRDLLIVCGGLVIMAVLFLPQEEGGGPIASPASAVATPHNRADPRPQEQVDFERITEVCRIKFQDSVNDIQRSAAFNSCNSARNEFVRQSQGGIREWVGEIRNLSTSQGGTVASLEIRSLSDRNVSYATHNNRLSDLFSETMLRPGEPVYQQVSNLPQGTRVKFSGRFLLSSQEELRVMALTERGTVNSPTLIVQFDEVRAF